MIYTRLLKAIFENYKETLSEEEYTSFVKFVHSMMDQFMNDLSQFSAGFARGFRMHELIDMEVDQNSHIKISCQKGCSACCHLEVEITEDEAAVLIEGIKAGIDIDLDRLHDLAQRNKRDEKWNLGAVPENRCVFLSEQGSCKAYHYRPAACRKAMVISNPNQCAVLDGKVDPVYMPKAEIIFSAALNLSENSFGPFAQMVYEKYNQNFASTEENQINMKINDL